MIAKIDSGRKLDATAQFAGEAKGNASAKDRKGTRNIGNRHGNLEPATGELVNDS